MSMLLHALGDLPLHHDDAHRHFFPFVDWRFISPLSYWNPDHHGDLISRLEFIGVLIGSVFLYLKHPSTRYWVMALGFVYPRVLDLCHPRLELTKARSSAP